MKSHGKSRTFEHRVWKGMRVRCNNKNHHTYKNYGGRGIKVCSQWNYFAIFLKDMGPAPSKKHSIERKDVNGNYEPGNCRWATKTEQMRNTRRNVVLVISGISKTLREWCNKTGINYDSARQRLTSGVSPENAIDPKWKKPARTACVNGHFFTQMNTYVYMGMKKCRACIRAAGRKLYQKKKRGARASLQT